jgi:hypothetical protein
MFEPALHGSNTSIDEMYRLWEQALHDRALEHMDVEDAVEEWGRGPMDVEQAQAAYDLFPQARPRQEVPSEDQSGPGDATS